WGPNWGYEIADAHRAFARTLIAEAGVSIVHGHSSHHPLGLEVIGRGLALYGCGDFLNDYEGIGGHEAYRGDLVLGFTAEVEPGDGALQTLAAHPFRIARFRLNRPSPGEGAAVLEVLGRESARFGVRVEPAGEDFACRWA